MAFKRQIILIILALGLPRAVYLGRHSTVIVADRGIVQVGQVLTVVDHGAMEIRGGQLCFNRTGECVGPVMVVKR